MIVSTFFSYCMSLFSFLSSLSLYPCVPYHSRLLYVCFFTLTLFNLPSFFSLFVPIKALSLSSLSLSLCTLSQSLALCMFLHSNSFCLPSFFPLFAPIKLRLSLSLYILLSSSRLFLHTHPFKICYLFIYGDAETTSSCFFPRPSGLSTVNLTQCDQKKIAKCL